MCPTSTNATAKKTATASPCALQRRRPCTFQASLADLLVALQLCILQCSDLACGAGIKKGDTNFTIKSYWWEQVGMQRLWPSSAGQAASGPEQCCAQVFNVHGDTAEALDMSVHFPNIKMILW